MIEIAPRPYLETLPYPKEWWLLEGTGFDVRTQIDKLKTQTKEGKPISLWVNQTVQDIMGYNLEYLQEGLIFPILLGIKGGRVVGTEYGDQPLTDTILPEERGGAVKESIQRIEQFLLTGESGATAVMVSPPGRSGLFREGSEIIFPDTQIYFFQKNQGGIKAMTLRMDLNLKKCQELLKKFGIEDAASVEGVVRNVVFRQNNFSVYDLIDLLEQTKGGKAYKNKNFDEMRADAHRLEGLWQMDKGTKEIIANFAQFALSLGELTEQNYHSLERVLGETLLKLTLFVRGGRRVVDLAYFNDLIPTDFLMALDTMRKIGGCAGGGLTAEAGLFGFRIGWLADSQTKKNWSYHEGTCVECGGENLLVGPCNICKGCEAKYN